MNHNLGKRRLLSGCQQQIKQHTTADDTAILVMRDIECCKNRCQILSLLHYSLLQPYQYPQCPKSQRKIPRYKPKSGKTPYKQGSAAAANFLSRSEPVTTTALEVPETPAPTLADIVDITEWEEQRILMMSRDDIQKYMDNRNDLVVIKRYSAKNRDGRLSTWEKQAIE